MNGVALTLGLSSLALAAFPLVRPFFRFDPTAPAETLAGAAPAVTSAAWLIAHYLALIGFVLLLCVLPALHARLAVAGGEARARRATLLSGIGVSLILPTLGVELYALPAIGRLYLDGQAAVAALVGTIYMGAAVLVMLLGLLLLAIGAILFARAAGKSGVLPRWAAVTYAVGLAFWCPLLPPPVRIVDGLLIGIGGVGLAWAMKDRAPLRSIPAGVLLILLAALPAAAQMPASIAEQIKAMGPVIDPPKTGAIYAPLHPREPHEGVTVVRDLKYGPDPRHALDVFTPAEGAAPRPVLVYVHGGAFVGGNKRVAGSPFYDNVVLAAARHGLVGVNMTYRLAPQHPWPAGAADVGDAVRWIHENIAAHGGDPARVYLMGHSSGAVHVASYVAFPAHHRGRGLGVAGAILVSGLFDFTATAPTKPELAYFGDKAGSAEVSSLVGLLKAPIPLLVAYGEFDPALFVVQAKRLNEALCREGRCPRFVALPQHSHMSEIYAINTGDTALSGPIVEFVRTGR